MPCHDEPLLLVHLLTAGEPGAEDRHIATLPLLVLPEAACQEVGFGGGGGGHGGRASQSRGLWARHAAPGKLQQLNTPPHSSNCERMASALLRGPGTRGGGGGMHCLDAGGRLHSIWVV